MVRPSVLPDAGMGVFAARRVMRGTALCLYPGTFLPPIPAGYVALTGHDDLVGAAARSTNAYICNLGAAAVAWDGSTFRDGCTGAVVGGSLDGSGPALAGLAGDALANPAAVGHLVNHASGAVPNATPVSFLWRHVLDAADTTPGVTAGAAGSGTGEGTRYPLPNVFVGGGAPWFVDAETGEVVLHPPPPATEEAALARGLCGLVFMADEDLEPGEEVLIDYALGARRAWPPWALPWYTPALRQGADR